MSLAKTNKWRTQDYGDDAGKEKHCTDWNAGSRKEHAAMLRGGICHTVKPDLDNLAKQLKDAMTRLRFWHDDKQVVRLVCEKRYGERPAWQVLLRRVGEARQAAKTRRKSC